MNCEITTFSKKEFAHYLKTKTVTEKYYSTPAGILKTKQTELGIFATQFITEGTDTNVVFNQTNKLILVGTEFQIQVWKAAVSIPEGKTSTYQILAKKIGRPKSFRAVANALANNNIAYFIPCHRVIRSDGSLGGYKWGIERKKQLLKIDK